MLPVYLDCIFLIAPWAIKNIPFRETGNIGYTRHRTNKHQRIPKRQSKIYNPEKLVT
jgi:hypothetical protein